MKNISLGHILSDRAEFIDWSDLAPDEIISSLTTLYRFLGKDVSVVVDEDVVTVRAEAIPWPLSLDPPSTTTTNLIGRE